MQEAILGFFQRIASPTLDTLANICSLVGESGFIIAVVAAVYWCVNKKKGFAICSTLLTSLVTMNLLKAVVRAPRPFQVLPEIEGKRLSTATGYSFPSGHTTAAATFYSSSAFAARKRVLSIICAIAIVLVGVSRMYLGVHWPIDVAGGLILGMTISLATYRLYENLFDNRKASLLYAVIVGAAGTVAAAIITIILSMGKGDPVALTDLMKMLALAGGGYLGFAMERKYVNYSVDGTGGRKLLRYVVGIVVLLLIMGSKAILPSHMFFGFLRYLLCGFWAIGLYPFLGSKIRIKGIALFPTMA